IGGGQLGRMMALAAKYMGYQVAVLDPTPNCPTAQVADQQITAAYDDMEAIEQLTSISDVVTYEFENVDLTAATYIENKGKLPQGAYALEVTQNREKEKTLMDEAALPVPTFFIVNNGKECENVLDDVSLPAVIKTCRGGYDGKGQIKLESRADFRDAIELAEQHQHCIIEEWIPFDKEVTYVFTGRQQHCINEEWIPVRKEISVVFTRASSGELPLFPIGENDHKDHILYQTTVPAEISTNVKEKALQAAETLAEKMNVVGTFAIEMFVKGEEIFINEMAPRPHNSGHYTIEACNISQFTQHIRAICGLPLMDVHLVQQSVMINILGEDLDEVLQKIPVLKH